MASPVVLESSWFEWAPCWALRLVASPVVWELSWSASHWPHALTPARPACPFGLDVPWLQVYVAKSVNTHLLTPGHYVVLHLSCSSCFCPNIHVFLLLFAPLCKATSSLIAAKKDWIYNHGCHLPPKEVTNMFGPLGPMKTTLVPNIFEPEG